MPKIWQLSIVFVPTARAWEGVRVQGLDLESVGEREYEVEAQPKEEASAQHFMQSKIVFTTRIWSESGP